MNQLHSNFSVRSTELDVADPSQEAEVSSEVDKGA